MSDDGRLGSVFLEDFDVGLVTTFGAVLVDIELDGEIVQDYAVQIPGVTGPDQYDGLIPVIFRMPEDVYQDGLIPNISIARSNLTPQMQRWHPVGQAYRVAARVAQQVQTSTGATGPNLVEMKGFALPFDIIYDIHLNARLRRQADAMLRYMGSYFWAYSQIFFTDNVGDERGYMAYLESIDNLDEVVDFADRGCGHLLSLRIEAELDFTEPIIARTAQEFVTSVAPGEPGNLTGD